MPVAETQVQTSIQHWKGVNQRLQPTLVPDDFFSWSKGVYFGLGDNAQRIFGKVLLNKLDGPIFNIFPWGEFAIVQQQDSLLLITTTEPPSPGGGEEETMSQAILHHRLTTNNVLASVATGSTWTLLPLNSVRSDPDSILSLASDQITLANGVYRVKAIKNFYASDRCKIRLWNVTDSVEVERGASGMATSPAGGTSSLMCRFTVSGGPKVYEFQYLTTSAISDGLTSYAPFPINTGGDEVDFVVEFLLEP
jgi:hypothetical protein